MTTDAENRPREPGAGTAPPAGAAGVPGEPGATGGPATAAVARQSMAVDIACVGFGPASGGFLTTLARAAGGADGRPPLESRALPGMPLQVVCYERADDLGFGVSGVVTRARAIRASFPDLDPTQLSMCAPVRAERLLYLRDPQGLSRRGAALRAIDRLIDLGRGGRPERDHALALPLMPGFLRKADGLLLSLGQFNQWVAARLMATGAVQLWPGMPVAGALIEGQRVAGVRLVDQGTDRQGRPAAGFLPGMDIRAELTVVGDGPVGPVGRQLDRHFGLPAGHAQDDWALGMKLVVELGADCPLGPGTVLHTFGYPEPEIFGFLYVYGERLASLGIFVPSWLRGPQRTGYGTLQRWLQHPYLRRVLEGATMRSWGAKSLAESGRRGEPQLAGDGYARIGAGSGSTNVLTGSGVDEAWSTGVALAEGVIELWRAGAPCTRANLERTYVARRRASWVEHDGRVAAGARNGFRRGFVRGMLGMGLAGLSGGRLCWPRGAARPPALQGDAQVEPEPGWPAIPLDGKLLVSHQDALLLGGKVQAPPGYADHVVFVEPQRCVQCAGKPCVDICSGQAITLGESDAAPQFDREKCVHCGACWWTCRLSGAGSGEPGRTDGNIDFRAAAGGLHSAEN